MILEDGNTYRKMGKWYHSLKKKSKCLSNIQTKFQVFNSMLYGEAMEKHDSHLAVGNEKLWSLWGGEFE